MLKVGEKAVGKDGTIGNRQIHLDLHPGVLSDLSYSKVHLLPLQCLSSS